MAEVGEVVVTWIEGKHNEADALTKGPRVRSTWDVGADSCAVAKECNDKMESRFGIKFNEVDMMDDYFLGANRRTTKERDRVMVSATSYIDSMVERYCDGDVTPSKRFPAKWSHVPADDDLVKAYERAVATKTPPSKQLFQDFNSIVGSLRHVVKYPLDWDAEA